MPIETLDVNALPALLAGPMIRRLTRTEVDIWALLKVPGDVALHIRNPQTNEVTWSQQPLRIGKELYLVNFYINAQVTHGPDGPAFAPRVTYEYWLEGLGPQNQELNTFDWSQLAYGSLSHPSFVGIPTAATDLKLVHVSCRKPHGGGRDGLRTLDQLLNEAFLTLEPPNNRPHCLVLTGDQIYADDVADALVPRMMQINEQLVAIAEPLLDSLVTVELPLPEGAPGAVKTTSIRVRKQQQDAWGFTTVDHNHAWRLGEYYALYMLAWSEVLWPNELPDWNTLRLIRKNEYDSLPVEERAKKEEEECEGITRQTADVENFRQDVRLVRKALANTPTWMIWDDHEVTDDWNLNYGWVYDVYKVHPEAQRIIRNGVAAYVLFQHLGNAPASFEVPGSPEQLVRDGLAWTGVHPLEQSPAPFSAVDLGLPPANDPALQDPSGSINLSGTYVMRPNYTTAGIRFDYTVPAAITGWPDFYPVHLVAVDNRTARDYHPLSSYGGRIESSALNAMLPDSPPAASLMVPTVIAFPAPLLALHARDQLVFPLLMMLKEDEAFVDVETNWEVSATKYDELLYRIASYSPAVVLAGDVHFSYTKRLVYEKGLPANPTIHYVAQFTASAAKNGDWRTGTMALVGEPAMQLNLVRDRSFVRYQGLTGAQRQALASPAPPPAGQPAVALPWDDFVDLTVGRIFRRGLETPAVVPAEVADGFNLDQVGAGSLPGPIVRSARYTIEYIDQQPADTAFDLPHLAPMINLPQDGWNGWDPDKSAQVVNALRLGNQLRIGQVIQGMGLLGVIRFEHDGQAYTVTQRMQMTVGMDATVPLRRAGEPDPQNLFEVVTSVRLGPHSADLAMEELARTAETRE
jgi:hypothetical protein